MLFTTIAAVGIFLVFLLALQRVKDHRRIKEKFIQLEGNNNRNLNSVFNRLNEDLKLLNNKISFLENIRHLPDRVLEAQKELEIAYTYLNSMEKALPSQRWDWFKSGLDHSQGLLDQMPELLENLDLLDINTNFSQADTDLKAILNFISHAMLFSQKTLNLQKEIKESKESTLNHIKDAKEEFEKITKLKPRAEYVEKANELSVQTEKLEENISNEKLPDWIYHVTIASLINTNLHNLYKKIINEREEARRRRERRRRSSSSSSFGGGSSGGGSFGGGVSGGGGASGSW